MRRFAYYNELDPEKAAWIRELIKAGVVAPGEVDERDIKLVQPADLRGFRQCHFFAGIAVWSYALRLAGWDDDREVWTGSCPCPSFSSAGKGQGFDDARHLWPDWVRLIRECHPATVFGEQADDAIGYGWLDLVQAEMEAENYAVGKAVLASAGVGASDIRERLYFVGEWLANYSGAGRRERRPSETSDHQRATERHESECEPERLRDAGRMGDSIRTRLEGLAGNGDNGNKSRRIGENATGSVTEASEPGGLADSIESGCGRLHPFADALKGHWRDADWLFCTDGEWRPVEPGTFPLAHGAPARLGRLRGYGDAINAEVAKAFIESYLATGATLMAG